MATKTVRILEKFSNGDANDNTLQITPPAGYVPGPNGPIVIVKVISATTGIQFSVGEAIDANHNTFAAGESFTQSLPKLGGSLHSKQSAAGDYYVITVL